ncbi:MAG: type II toxin-antitoxin system HicA family toxin [Candidatus Omnitrophica bacterium]|nr:type II toxin-antitoxin system HicA family toxin [Candidatus Omnitrophota bacterium]
MPRFGPIKQKELVKYLRLCGFDGPYSGGKHPFMVKDYLTITIPNPHKGDIGKELLSRILKQAKISKEKWEEI